MAVLVMAVWLAMGGGCALGGSGRGGGIGRCRGAGDRLRALKDLPECWQLLTRCPRTHASQAYFSPSIIIAIGC